MSASPADFEAAYWGDCLNTFDEEQKHFVYAQHMGLSVSGYHIDAAGARVLDIGGGPVSILLKCENRWQTCAVLDPLMSRYPEWVLSRYMKAGIECYHARGEELTTVEPMVRVAAQPLRLLLDRRDGITVSQIGVFDEVWIYNVLQHVEDPAKVIQNAKGIAPTLRLFEWIDIPPHDGHPHMLTAPKLTEWIGASGNVVQLAERGCYGRAFYGWWRFR